MVYLLSAFLSAFSMGNDVCDNKFAQLEFRKTTLVSSTDKFWERTTPIFLHHLDTEENLTFSFDAELPFADVFRTIQGDKAALEKVDSELEKIVIPNPERFSLDKIPRNRLPILFKYSLKQIDSFALRRGIGIKESYKLTDFNPNAIERLIDLNDFKYYLEDLTHTSSKEIDRIMMKQGIPIAAFVDGVNVELRHYTSESSPAKFYDLITKKLHKLFKNPQTHLHIGLPAKTVTKANAFKIARAVEIRVLSKLIEDWTPGSAKIFYVQGSTLTKHSIAGGISTPRGIIKLEFDQFHSPFLAHDLEIRQWFDIKDGLENIAVASELATKHDLLFDNLDQSFIFNCIHPSIGNFCGALQYLADFFRKRGNSSLASELEELLPSASDDNIRKAQALFKKHKIVEKLDANFFLK